MQSARLFCVGLLICSVLLFACQAVAAPAKLAPAHPAINNPALKTAPQTATPNLQQPAAKIVQQKKPVLLPDIAVTKIEVVSNCSVVWTIKNLGPGQLADAAFVPGSGVRIVSSSSIAGNLAGPSLASIDPTKVLKRPGGTVGYTTVRKASAQSEKFTVTLQNAHVSGEVNINNNRLVKSLSCEVAPMRGTQPTSQFSIDGPRVIIEDLAWMCDAWNHCEATAVIRLGSKQTTELQTVTAAHLMYPDGWKSKNDTKWPHLLPNVPYQFRSSTIEARDPLPAGTVLILKVMDLEGRTSPPYPVLAEEHLTLN